MRRNAVQFQKGLSLNEFPQACGDEDKCFDALFRLRWPDGFVCPNCGHDKSGRLNTRQLRQRCRCQRQASVTAGALFESSKLPLTVWFQAVCLLTQSKKGVSAMHLHRQLGIPCNAAWRLRHKRMQVMLERDGQKRLSGLVQMDDAYLGGKLSAVKGFRKSEIRKWAERHLAAGTHAVSDGLRCFDAVAAAGCTHEAIVSGGGRAAVEKDEFYWVNTVLGNLKTGLRSSCHSFDAKYAQRCLAEFEYRFNRRYRLADMVPRLAFVALRTPPMPERLLKHGLC